MKACVVFLMRGVHSVSTLDHDAMMMYLSPTEASLIRRQIRIQIATHYMRTSLQSLFLHLICVIQSNTFFAQ